MYPEDDSSGAVFTPPEVKVLVGGKRRGGKAKNRRANKKNKSKNDKVQGSGLRVAAGLFVLHHQMETANETA